MRGFGALLILAFLAHALAAGDAAALAVAIQPVKTWNDLAKQPSIDLAKNATARFGIQTLRAPLHGGVMLYCMTEAFDPDDEDDPYDDEKLGPFKVSVQAPPNDAEKDVKRALAEKKQKHVPGKRDYGKLVFAQVVAMGKVGTYTVELKNAKEETVASAKIECVDAPYHPWAAFSSAEEAAKVEQEIDGGQIPEADVGTATTGAAVPRFYGGVPVRYVLSGGERGPVKFSEDDPLPILPEPIEKEFAPLTKDQESQAAKWIDALASDFFAARAKASEQLLALGTPANELMRKAIARTADAETLTRLRAILEHHDGPFQISLEGTNVLLHTTLPFDSGFFEDNFLARWWVNGKPAMPAEIKQDISRAINGAGQMSKVARLKLKFEPAALGAKSGDTIGLQLLYCPDGTDFIGEKMEHLKTAHEDSDEEAYPDRFPVVSNKVEFEVP